MLNKINYQFIEIMPNNLDEGTLYISIPYKVCTHLCFCGCGEKVITSLTPNSWYLIFNGETISLSPSIGSSNLKCLSHYYITNNNVIWFPKMKPIRKKPKKWYEWF